MTNDIKDKFILIAHFIVDSVAGMDIEQLINSLIIIKEKVMREINRKELKDKLNKDDVTLIEVLEPEEYEKGHIKHAINIPLETIVTEAREKFPLDEEIVVYCSDYECTASPAAAKKLEDTGFKNIYHYPGGKKDWREAGLPIER